MPGSLPTGDGKRCLLLGLLVACCMSLPEELQKLADLYDDGVLTEQEFTEAKRQLLQPAPKTPVPLAPDPTLGKAAETYVSFQIVMGIVGFVIFLIFFFGFWLPAFNRMH